MGLSKSVDDIRVIIEGGEMINISSVKINSTVISWLFLYQNTSISHNPLLVSCRD